MATTVVLTTACSDKDGNIPVTGVTLEKYKLTLVVGAKETLIAIVAPSDATDQTVNWSSNNPEVATVDVATGEVTAEAVGIATITAKSNDGGKPAYCTVTVTDKPVELRGISLDKTALSLLEGVKESLNVIFEPADATNKNVIWSITGNDPEVISFNESTGEVTAIATGMATIRVTAEEGDGKFYDECKVTVMENTIKVTGVTLNKKSLTLKTGQTEILTASIVPSDAADKTVTWSLINNNPQIISFDESTGTVTAIAVGTATVKVTTVDGGFYDECAVTVEESQGVEGNLLENPGFDDVFAPWTAMSLGNLQNDDPETTQSAAANLTDDSFWAGNGSTVQGHNGQTARMPTGQGGSGLYQLVEITSGKTYQYKFDIVAFQPGAQAVKPVYFRIKSENGSEKLYEIEINAEVNVWKEITGSLTIPSDYDGTNVRFQISRNGNPSGVTTGIAGTLIDDCEFFEVK